MTIAIIIGSVLIGAFVLFLLSLPSLIHNSSPSEVLIISGKRRREGDRIYGYRIAKGGYAFQIPLLERVDRMDLTNMVIDVSANNAYCKGGVPLTVQGVANVKIAGHSPVLNNAIERFLGRSRAEIMQVAKATLEGALRGILSTMTPEQVNEDKLLFAERLVHEVEADMTALGLVVDTMKIQNVHDEVKYLDSIGRKRSAEIVSSARVAEATSRAESIIREAENLEREVQGQIQAQIQAAKADAQKRLTDALTRRDALIAEERAVVMAQVAQASAEVNVQKARVEQVRRKLDADVIQPAVAWSETASNEARASTASIIEDGRARAEALRALADAWEKAGPAAREVMLTQKLQPIIEAMTAMIAETRVDKMTMIDSAQGSTAAKAISTVEQVKQLFGIDLVEKVKQLGEPKTIEARVVPARDPE